MVLHNLIKTATVNVANRCDTVDLGDTYRLSKIMGACCSDIGGARGGGINYSMDGQNWNGLPPVCGIRGGLSWDSTSDPPRNDGIYARYLSFCCYNYYSGSMEVNVYEGLFATTMTASIDRTIVPYTGSFTISGNVKDQNNNVMDGQAVSIAICCQTLVTYNVTTDENGNFSKIISTGGWGVGSYSILVTSDALNQLFSVNVVSTSSVKFDSLCSDTNLPCSADMALDGEFKGVTPLTVPDVAVGTHPYKVSRTGYLDATGEVEVVQGITAEVNVTLTPAAKGSISFITTPSGAEVCLDGAEYEEKTPVTVLNIPVGTHSYVLKLNGFKDYEGSVLVEANATSTVDVTLTPSEGCIYFASNPAGAKIIVDGVDTGKVTPDVICGLSLGSHTYRLELAGYKAITGSVGTGAGEGRTVSEALIKEGAGAGTVLGIALLSVGILGAVIVSRRRG